VFETRSTPQFCNSNESSPGPYQRDSLCDPRYLLPSATSEARVRVTQTRRPDPLFPGSPPPRSSGQVALSFSGPWHLLVWGNRISHLRLQIVKIRRCRSFLALVASLADSPRICCRVLPEAFPANSSSAGVVRRVSTAPSRLDWPGEILALSPLSHSSQARQKPGIADRANPPRGDRPSGPPRCNPLHLDPCPPGPTAPWNACRAQPRGHCTSPFRWDSH
jgi:hypothetical protein